jgi:hypothetical protein
LTGVLAGNLARGWQTKPHLKDPKNWPKAAQEEWGSDQGATTGKIVQQQQIEQFKKVRAALDEFKPDLMVIMYRDLGEVFRNFAKPTFYIHAQDKYPIKTFQIFGNRENYFEEDPDRLDAIPGHKEGALYLARRLQDMDFDPTYAPESMMPDVLGHNCRALILHLDWERREFKTPVVPIGIDPFGFLRTRNNEGMSAWDPKLPGPLSPRRGFALGRAMAKAFKESPWRVAIVAGGSWSHANDSGWEFERVVPDIEADKRRFEEWKGNKFDKWGETITWEEMEKHAQWELLPSIVLAGAMTEVGAKVKYADFCAYNILNSSWITTVFEPK